MRLHLISWLLVVVGARCPANRDSPNETQKLRMEAIKVQILSKLRLNQEVSSNVTRNNLDFHLRWQVDDYYNNEIRRKQQDSTHSRYYQSSQDYFSKTIKVFRFPEETILTPNTRHYQFDSTLGNRYVATGATLKMGISFRETRKDPRNKNVRLFKLTTTLEELQTQAQLLDELLQRPIQVEKIRTIKASNEHTFDFDLQLTFSRWSQWPDTNYGLLVCVGKCFEEEPGINFDEVFTGNQEFNRPLLSIDTYEENHSRKKRSGYDCANPRQQKKCCRYHYYVKFADLGMDWILAPEGYDAYYCSGDCPFMYLSEQKSSLYYTFVIARANYNNPMASPRPCCTPASLSDMSIMYSSGKVDSQGQPTDIEIHNLDDMVVDECGCS
uniref:TGF_beta domain-containing protein n=3 Tax=Bathyctena chuni TaxID=1403704 RepID=V9PPJ0_BATCU|nr:TGF_beta domain-containing protein [Bathyctena chuni]